MSEHDNKEGVASENTTTDEKDLREADLSMEEQFKRGLPGSAWMYYILDLWLRQAGLSAEELRQANPPDGTNLDKVIVPEGWREALQDAGLISKDDDETGPWWRLVADDDEAAPTETDYLI